MDAENLDLDADSFDAAISRIGLHNLPDPPKALRGMRRVVKPGGKVAAIVYSIAEKNPYLGVPATVRASLGCYTVREEIDALAAGLDKVVELTAKN